MTRWARGNNAHRKLPSDATAWQQLRPLKSPVDDGPSKDEPATDSSKTSIKVLKRKKHKHKSKTSEQDLSSSTTEHKDEAESPDRVTKRDKSSKTKQFKQSKNNKSSISKDSNSVPKKSDLSVDQKKEIKNLKKRLQAEGVPRSEIWHKMRRERSKGFRRENRRGKICFKCRKFGHVVADCPNAGSSADAGICFKCGSTEHMSKDCRNKTRTGQDSFPFASCFVCGERGHLSSNCPDNPDGLYPRGGSCHECGSVRHLRRDCPNLVKEKEDGNEVVLHVQDQWGSADAEVETKLPETIAKQQPKVIAFK